MAMEEWPRILDTSGLGRSEGQPLVPTTADLAGVITDELDDLLPDDQVSGLEVHIGPAQSERLAAAQARGRDEFNWGAELIGAGVIQKAAQFMRLPGVHSGAWVLVGNAATRSSTLWACSLSELKC
jgi:hypothetical protein